MTPRRLVLRATVPGLALVYMLLWTVGTGCGTTISLAGGQEIDEESDFFDLIVSCSADLDLAKEVAVPGGERTDVVSVEAGARFAIPDGRGTVTGTVAGDATEIESGIEHRAAGDRLRVDDDWPLDMSVSQGAVSGGFQAHERVIEPGDRITYWMRPDAGVTTFRGQFEFESSATAIVGAMGTGIRFPPRSDRGGFASLIDMTFGVDYPLPGGALQIVGSVAEVAGTGARTPKKLIFLIEHLDDRGRIRKKHKQVVKVQGSGTFKTSTKQFGGFDVAAGERVRIRVKPKKGDLSGLDWFFDPFLFF